MTSIRKTITWRLMVGTALLFAGGGVLLGASMRRLVEGEFDRGLESKAKALALLPERDGTRFEFEFDDRSVPEFSTAERPDYFEFFGPDGAGVRTSLSLGDADLPFQTAASPRVFRNIPLPDGRRGRLVQWQFTPRNDEEEPVDAGTMFVTVARGRERIDALLLSLYVALALAGLLLVSAIAILVRRTVRRGLHPLDEVNRQIQTVGPDDLQVRVRVKAAPEEIEPVVRALNGLLDRLGAAFERERRFTADVAHELNTPVSELRTATEVTSRWSDAPADVRRFAEDVNDMAREMEKTVGVLRTLAHCDGGIALDNVEQIDLKALAASRWRHGEKLAEERNLTFVNCVEDDLTTTANRDALTLMLRNVFENAIAHAQPGTAVTCRGAPSGAGVTLIIENRSSGLEPGDIEHIFERFWRKDPARGDRDHLGLGLSIVKAVADLLEIAVCAGLTDDGLFQVQFTFPGNAQRVRAPGRA